MEDVPPSARRRVPRGVAPEPRRLPRASGERRRSGPRTSGPMSGYRPLAPFGGRVTAVEPSAGRRGYPAELALRPDHDGVAVTDADVRVGRPGGPPAPARPWYFYPEKEDRTEGSRIPRPAVCRGSFKGVRRAGATRCSGCAATGPLRRRPRPRTSAEAPSRRGAGPSGACSGTASAPPQGGRAGRAAHGPGLMSAKWYGPGMAAVRGPVPSKEAVRRAVAAPIGNMRQSIFRKCPWTIR